MAVSALDPLDYSAHMTHADTKDQVPKRIFAGLRVFDLFASRTGSVGPAYDRILDHLRDCINAVTNLKSTSNKIVNPGIWICEAGPRLFYPMKSLDDQRRHHLS